jgi:L-amino acid N-acyltransferase YncA
MNARLALPQDAQAIAEIYNQSIAARTSTFETRLRSADDIRAWFDGIHPIVVVEDQGQIRGFASTSTYRPRDCYSGVAEFSVYVDHDWRQQGVGRMAMQALIQEAQNAGFWKLVSRVFAENSASLGLLAALGFRQVGIYEKHARLDSLWKDVVIVEYLIRANL